MADVSLNCQIIATTTAPSQAINVTLAGQACLINLYTKSINLPLETAPAGSEVVYENQNPCFVDLYLINGSPPTLIIGGVQVRNGGLIVRDIYLGFQGDLAIIDTTGAGQDPFGVPPTLPPLHLRNWWQKFIPLSLGSKAPPAIAGSIPGMGTRFLLTYWPVGSYTPGYSALT
ncbi:MAG: hypothetical protein KGO96_10585 [Elusimicrobia bacterium]|nr:hypothetical protein [Elusimicrobiota bacterium]